MDEDGSFITGCLDPLKRDRMVLSHITAHVQNNVSVSKIDIMIGHGTASERLSQSRYRGAVSDTGLMFNVNDAERSEELCVEPAFFIIQRCASH